jgi:hypothetical protein
MPTELRSPFPTPRDHVDRKIEEMRTLLPPVARATEVGVELIAARKADARRLLRGALLRDYLITADNVESALKGVSRYFTVGEYALVLAEAANTDGTERDRHLGEFTMQAAQDLAAGGFERFGPRLLGQAATVVIRAASAFTSVLLTSSDIGRGPEEIIRDPQTSLREKQDAAGRLWRQYEKYGHAWAKSQRDQLEELSGIVYSLAIQQEAVVVAPR